jgi:mRNA interferase MazF
VQNDIGNENAPTTIVAPFTTSFGDDLYPFEVFLAADDGPLHEDSVAVCSQLRTVSIEQRISENTGSIPDGRLEDVDTALQYSLGLLDV